MHIAGVFVSTIGEVLSDIPVKNVISLSILRFIGSSTLTERSESEKLVQCKGHSVGREKNYV